LSAKFVESEGKSDQLGGRTVAGDANLFQGGRDTGNTRLAGSKGGWESLKGSPSRGLLADEQAETKTSSASPADSRKDAREGLEEEKARVWQIFRRGTQRVGDREICCDLQKNAVVERKTVKRREDGFDCKGLRELQLEYVRRRMKRR